MITAPHHCDTGCDDMAVYICKCLFCFESVGEPERCPDCGGINVRYTTDEEAAEYARNKAETREKAAGIEKSEKA